jgi:hypothetical protein
MKNVSFQKPYISQVDGKVKFIPRLHLVSTSYTCEEAFDLIREIHDNINEIKITKSFLEKYKDDRDVVENFINDMFARDSDAH